MASRSFVVGLVVALSLAFATPLYAQDQGDDMDLTGAYSLTTSSYAAIISVPVALTVLVVVLLVRSSSEMENYIKENNVALQHDLHMGGGQTAADLATFFYVPVDQHAAFAQVLSESRDGLLPLTDINTLSPERAGDFVRVIYDAMMERPELAQHLPRVAG